MKKIKNLSKKEFVKVNVKKNKSISLLVIVFQKVKMFKKKEKKEKKRKNYNNKKTFFYYYFVFDVITDLHSCWSIYNFKRFKFNYNCLYCFCKNTFERSKINMN